MSMSTSPPDDKQNSDLITDEIKEYDAIVLGRIKELNARAVAPDNVEQKLSPSDRIENEQLKYLHNLGESIQPEGSQAKPTAVDAKIAKMLRQTPDDAINRRYDTLINSLTEDLDTVSTILTKSASSLLDNEDLNVLRKSNLNIQLNEAIIQGPQAGQSPIQHYRNCLDLYNQIHPPKNQPQYSDEKGNKITDVIGKARELVTNWHAKHINSILSILQKIEQGIPTYNSKGLRNENQEVQKELRELGVAGREKLKTDLDKRIGELSKQMEQLQAPSLIKEKLFQVYKTSLLLMTLDIQKQVAQAEKTEQSWKGLKNFLGIGKLSAVLQNDENEVWRAFKDVDMPAGLARLKRKLKKVELTEELKGVSKKLEVFDNKAQLPWWDHGRDHRDNAHIGPLPIFKTSSDIDDASDIVGVSRRRVIKRRTTKTKSSDRSVEPTTSSDRSVEPETSWQTEIQKGLSGNDDLRAYLSTKDDLFVERLLADAIATLGNRNVRVEDQLGPKSKVDEVFMPSFMAPDIIKEVQEELLRAEKLYEAIKELKNVDQEKVQNLKNQISMMQGNLYKLQVTDLWRNAYKFKMADELVEKINEFVPSGDSKLADGLKKTLVDYVTQQIDYACSWRDKYLHPSLFLEGLLVVTPQALMRDIKREIAGATHVINIAKVNDVSGASVTALTNGVDNIKKQLEILTVLESTHDLVKNLEGEESAYQLYDKSFFVEGIYNKIFVNQVMNRIHTIMDSIEKITVDDAKKGELSENLKSYFKLASQIYTMCMLVDKNNAEKPELKELEKLIRTTGLEAVNEKEQKLEGSTNKMMSALQSDSPRDASNEKPQDIRSDSQPSWLKEPPKESPSDDSKDQITAG